MKDKNVLVSYFALFSSLGTLICCALPALFVTLGAGATLASTLSAFPQLIWFSEHKTLVFSVAGLCIISGFLLMWANRNAPCPIDPELARACKTGRKISLITLIFSLLLYLVGLGFAYLPQVLAD